MHAENENLKSRAAGLELQNYQPTLKIALHLKAYLLKMSDFDSCLKLTPDEPVPDTV